MWYRNRRTFVLAGIMLLIVLSSYTMHRISESSVEKRMLDIVSEADSLPDQEILGWFEDYKETIRISGEFFLYNDWKAEEIQRYFSDKIAVEGDFLRLYFSDGDGSNIVYPDVVLPEDYEPRVRSWYQQAIQSDEVIITEIYTGATNGVKMITVAMAISDFSGNFLGVIAGDIPVARIQERVSRRSEDFEGGIAILGNEEDRIEAFGSSEMADFHEEIIYKAHSELIEGKSFEFVTIEALKTSRGYYLLSWLPVEDSPWRVITYTPLGESLAQSQAALRLMVEIFLVILGIGVFIWVLMYRPYQRLIHGIRKVNVQQAPEYRIIWKESWGFAELVDHLNDFLSQCEKKHLYIMNSLNRQETLYEENRVMEALFKGVPHGLVRLDKEGCIVDFNEYFSDLFGVTLKEVKELALTRVIGFGERLPEETSLEEKVFEGVRHDAAGNPVPLRIHVLPVVAGEELVKTYVIYHAKKE